MLAEMPRLYGHDHGARAPRDARTRKVSRTPVHRGVWIASKHGCEAEATVRDISTHGCSIRSDADWLRLGGFLSLEVEADAAIMGIVRWVRDGAAGIEFLRPLQAGQPAWDALIADCD